MAQLGNTIINGALRANGKINASGAITAPSFVGVASQIKGTLTNPTSTTSYFIPFFAEADNAAGKNIRLNNGIRYHALEGTTSAVGAGILILGNGTPSGTAGNKYGAVQFASTKEGGVTLRAADSTTSKTIYLPAADGTLALTTSNVASATKATQDSAGQQINTTYIKGLSVSGKTITYTRGDNTTGTITTQDNNTTYSAGEGLTLSGTTFSVGKRWTAVTQGQKWSRICYIKANINIVGISGILSIGCTRGNVVTNYTFMINASHAQKVSITQLNGTKYSSVRIRGVADENGSTYIELYDTAQSIASGTAQSWYCSWIPILQSTITTYTAFTDGSTVPANHTVGSDFTTAADRAIVSSTFYGTLSGNASSSTYATNARLTDTNPASGTWYYPTWTSGYAANTNYPLRANDGLRYYSLQGTTSAGGRTILQIGNSVASGTAGNKYGEIWLFSTNTGRVQLLAPNTTGTYNVTFPSSAGTLALVESTPATHSGTAAPASTLGKNGDIYVLLES
mgnify:CR=1 FL=1